MITLEYIDQQLVKAQVQTIIHPEPEGVVGYFERSRYFTVEGVGYEIEWWVDGCYLKSGNLIICFDDLFVSNSWPHNSPMDLRFDLKNNTAVILKLVEYKK